MFKLFKEFNVEYNNKENIIKEKINSNNHIVINIYNKDDEQIFYKYIQNDIVYIKKWTYTENSVETYDNDNHYMKIIFDNNRNLIFKKTNDFIVKQKIDDKERVIRIDYYDNENNHYFDIISYHRDGSNTTKRYKKENNKNIFLKQDISFCQISPKHR